MSPQRLPEIPLLDLRPGGPVEHARRRRRAMLQLREACFSIVPAPLRRLADAWTACRALAEGIAEPLCGRDRRDRRRSPDGPACGSSTRPTNGAAPHAIDVEPIPYLRRTLDWPFPGLGTACRGGSSGWRRGSLCQRDLAGSGRRPDGARAGPFRCGDQPGAALPPGRCQSASADRFPAQRRRHLAPPPAAGRRRISCAPRSTAARTYAEAKRPARDDTGRAADAVLPRRRRAGPRMPDRAHGDRGGRARGRRLRRQRLAPGQPAAAGALDSARTVHDGHARVRASAAPSSATMPARRRSTGSPTRC